MTTLIDAAAYPWDEVASLYLHRWEIELRFRDIKTTMGMEMLRTKSPEMVHKEVLMHMIASNPVRLMMIKAGKTHRINHRRISFKGVVQVLEECRSGFERIIENPVSPPKKRPIFGTESRNGSLPSGPEETNPAKRNEGRKATAGCRSRDTPISNIFTTPHHLAKS